MAQTTFYKKIENTSAIAALGTWSPSAAQLTENEITKYAPFNSLTIFNNSDKDVDVRLAGSNLSDTGVEHLPAGATLVFDPDENVFFHRPTIYNRDASASIAVNEIICVIRKVS